MKKASIQRLRRIVKLTERLYEERARAVAVSKGACDEITLEIDAAHTYLESEDAVATAFTDIVLARAGRLNQRLDTAQSEFDALVNEAAEARASVKGLSGKLERAISSDAQDTQTRVLDELIDRVARSKVSLR